MLTALFIAPALTAVLLLLVPRRAQKSLRAVAISGALVSLGFAAYIATAVQSGPGRFSFEIRHSWIASIGSSFHIGVDGLSIWFLLLNAVLAVVAVSSTDAGQPRFREHLMFLMLLEAGMAGVFMALDLILFYFFWEAMLIPAYFIVGIWGRSKPGAAFRFVLFTLFGSLLMLVAILVLYFAAARNSFDLTDLAPSGIASDLQLVLFAAFALAFAIKSPLIPFHAWLPDTYEATPAADLVLIAGVMGKTGVYGFLRLGVLLFPHPQRALGGLSLNLLDVLPVLAGAGILYGAWLAINQTDMKRLIAFSSVSHMGFIVLGVFTLNRAGVDGAVLQSVNHGVIVAGLFLLAAAIERRCGTRDLRRIGWLAGRAPVLAGVFALVALAALGLPGLNGFVGEFLIVVSAWQSWPVLAVLAVAGMILASVYMLRLYQGTMQGERTGGTGAAVAAPARAVDLRWSELLPLAPLCALIVLLGVYPYPVTSAIDPAAGVVLQTHTPAVPGIRR